MDATKPLQYSNIGDKVESTTVHKRSVHVEASGDFIVVPDQCHLLISISSHKGSISQAKDSVARRTLYIMQAVQNAQIQVALPKYSVIVRLVTNMCFSNIYLLSSLASGFRSQDI